MPATSRAVQSASSPPERVGRWRSPAIAGSPRAAIAGWLRAAAAAAAIVAAAWAPAPAGARVRHPFPVVPIGAGDAYSPPARWPLAGAAAFRGLATDLHAGARVHLEVFAGRRVVVIPGGIGISGGRTELYGNVVDALWHAPAWTTVAGGVIHVAEAGARLRDFFAVWGPALRFRGDPVAFVDGARWRGDPGDIPLADGRQIVLEIGGYVKPHPAFAFAPPPIA